MELLPNKFSPCSFKLGFAMSFVSLVLLATVFACGSDTSSSVTPERKIEVVKAPVILDIEPSETMIAIIPSPPKRSEVLAGNESVKREGVQSPLMNDQIISQEESKSGRLKEGNSDLKNLSDIVDNTIMRPYEKKGFYKNAQAQIRGKYLPIMVQGYDDPAIGLPAPEIKAFGLDGSEIFIGGEGPTTLIMVLAHWCPHCRNEVRELSAFLGESEAMDRVRMITLLTSINEERANFPPHTWLEMEEWPLPSIVDTSSSQIATALGVSSFPFFIVLNDKGEIELRIPGRLGLETLTKLLDAIGDMGGEN